MIATVLTAVLTQDSDSSSGFTINFVRRENLPAWVRLLSAYGVMGYLAVSLLLSIWLIGGTAVFFFQAHHLRADLQGRLPNPAALAVLKQEMQDLDDQATLDLSQFNALSNLQKQRFPVGGKLAALAKTIPARTWVMQMSSQRAERSIDIQAAYLVDSGTPYRIPAKKWVQALQEDPVFKKGLRGVSIGSSSRKTQGDSELYFFNLSADWQR